MIVKIDLTNDNSYEIYIEKLKALSFDRKVVVVTNPTVAGFHLEYLKSKLTAKELSICTIKDGEEYKNMQTLEDILSSCFEAKLDRKSLLIAFGGGVIGDMTGFAASIYQRGIDFIQIPTTLLSQVDASVGGKTGINNKYGKNLVGTFHQPKAVYIDSSFLKTLPKRELGAGISEIIKMAVCFNSEFFSWLENNDLKDEKNIDIAIQKSVETKAYVVRLTQSIRQELFMKHSKVRISALCPGPVNTNFNKVADVKFNLAEANSKHVAKYAVRKRIAVPA